MNIQAVISGFQGRPCTVYAYYDEESDVLVISKEAASRSDRFKDCFLISNIDLPERDAVFAPEDFNDAITHFFEMICDSKLTIKDAASRCNPTNSIEKDGVNENGKRAYRISPETSNGQVAVLSIVWHVKNARTVCKVLDMQDRFADLQLGMMMTI
ncbi:hypothetical protein [Undibacterium crateris]|uniref:hypothetical protein n=1 Tax=Undibacterium crateris TaxID=2528175 RepID=UPI001389D35B|nr:hypothetical protein [Undibacterium crateris]NDI85083.1 hypothetical protein [Undibacterium crateris]